MLFVIDDDHDTRALPSEERNMFDPMIKPDERGKEPFRTFERKKERINCKSGNSETTVTLEERPVLTGRVRSLACGAVARGEFEKAPRNTQAVGFYKESPAAPGAHQLARHIARTVDMMHDVEIDNRIIFAVLAGETLRIGLHCFET